MRIGINKYAMGLFPVGCVERPQENYNLTSKQYCLRNQNYYYLSDNLSKINNLLLNVILRWQKSVVSKACSVLLQVLLIKYLYHNRGK